MPCAIYKYSDKLGCKICEMNIIVRFSSATVILCCMIWMVLCMLDLFLRICFVLRFCGCEFHMKPWILCFASEKTKCLTSFCKMYRFGVLLSILFCTVACIVCCGLSSSMWHLPCVIHLYFAFIHHHQPPPIFFLTIFVIQWRRHQVC